MPRPRSGARRPAVRRPARATTPPPDVAVARAGTRAGLAANDTARIVRLVLGAEHARGVSVSVTYVGNARMRALNMRHFRRRGDTDVIAFALPGPGAAIAGDVYVSPDAARTAADALGISVREEVMRLVVHGVLHVLGYDHPDGTARLTSPMWRRQEALLARARSAVRA